MENSAPIPPLFLDLCNNYQYERKGSQTYPIKRTRDVERVDGTNAPRQEPR